jgi:hypothetical protein
MAAVTRVSHSGSVGRAYFDKKIVGGKTPKEALRPLQVSDAVFPWLRADAQRAATRAEDPGGQLGNGSAYPARSARTPAARASHSRVP